jgi:hypothetical protein
MITVKLELDELILLADLCQRSKSDFDPHLYYEPEDLHIDGYASVVLLQTFRRLELLEQKLGRAAPEPLAFCTATQSLRLESHCEWHKDQARGMEVKS